MRTQNFNDWRPLGRCSKLNPIQTDKLFFPDAGRSINNARKFCTSCPVYEKCLDFALVNEVKGIWAGTNEKERRALVKFNNRALNQAVSAAPRRSGKTRKRNVIFH